MRQVYTKLQTQAETYLTNKTQITDTKATNNKIPFFTCKTKESTIQLQFVKKNTIQNRQ